MTTFLAVLVGLCMFATFGVLVAGMLGMTGGNQPGAGIARAERSNRLMRWRIILQGVTLVLFALLLSLIRH